MAGHHDRGQRGRVLAEPRLGEAVQADRAQERVDGAVLRVVEPAPDRGDRDQRQHRRACRRSAAGPACRGPCRSAGWPGSVRGPPARTIVTTVQIRLLISGLDDDRVLGHARRSCPARRSCRSALSPSQSVRLNHSDVHRRVDQEDDVDDQGRQGEQPGVRPPYSRLFRRGRGGAGAPPGAVAVAIGRSVLRPGRYDVLHLLGRVGRAWSCPAARRSGSRSTGRPASSGRPGPGSCRTGCLARTLRTTRRTAAARPCPARRR